MNSKGSRKNMSLRTGSTVFTFLMGFYGKIPGKISNPHFSPKQKHDLFSGENVAVYCQAIEIKVIFFHPMAYRMVLASSIFANLESMHLLLVLKQHCQNMQKGVLQMSCEIFLAGHSYCSEV